MVNCTQMVYDFEVRGAGYLIRVDIWSVADC